jgi:sulfate transport system permease protein
MRPARVAAAGRARPGPWLGRWSLRTLGLGYLALLLVLPVGVIGWRSVSGGLGKAWDSITTPIAVHALVLTLEVAAIAVPLNVVFGVGAAMLLSRRRFPGARLLDSVIELPLAISPVVIGVALLLLYGRQGWFGSWLTQHGVTVIFSIPGIVIASVFVSAPYVAREVMPVLGELGTEQEQAAATLGAGAAATFWRITLPSIRWAVAYGTTLTAARVLGEFGAVSVVSGNIEGQTQTLTMFVDDRFTNFDQTGAYTGAVVLALISLAVLGVLSVSRGRARSRDVPPDSPQSQTQLSPRAGEVTQAWPSQSAASASDSAPRPPSTGSASTSLTAR